MMTEYEYQISPISIDKLSQEIRANVGISIALDSISALGIAVTFKFRAPLSEAEIASLEQTISAHDGIPPPAPEETIKVSQLPEQEPFAKPSFRTKRTATTDPVQVAPGAVGVIDYVLPVERYVSGGVLLVEGAEFGDHIMAEVFDPNGVIPAPYRAAMCEQWPSVAVYVEKEFIEVKGGQYNIHRIDTYPLNAKITAGLALRLTYHATNAGSTRSVAVNYNMSKKL
jgi:hypothetical protein